MWWRDNPWGASPWPWNDPASEDWEPDPLAPARGCLLAVLIMLVVLGLIGWFLWEVLS